MNTLAPFRVLVDKPEEPEKGPVGWKKRIREALSNAAPHLLAAFDHLCDESTHDTLIELRKECGRLLEEADTALKKYDTDLDRVRELHNNEMRALKKAYDPEAVQLKIMYAVDEANAAKDKELAELRASLATKDSEIAELKRSKKRLREAIDRLSKDA